MPSAANLDVLNAQIVACEACPRLRAYGAEIARVRKRQWRDWSYWGLPVPSFGDPEARVLVLGLAIRWTAILTLGKSFSANVAIRDAQRVHKAGLYRFVRHPSYLGLMLIFLAIGLHARNWISLTLVLVPTFLALSYRIHVEEGALSEAFGEEYAAYRRGTKRLVPGVF